MYLQFWIIIFALMCQGLPMCLPNNFNYQIYRSNILVLSIARNFCRSNLPVQQGPEIHGLKLHRPCRYTFCNWIPITSTRTTVVKTFSCPVFIMILSSLYYVTHDENFWATQVFSDPKQIASLGLTVAVFRATTAGKTHGWQGPRLARPTTPRTCLEFAE